MMCNASIEKYTKIKHPHNFWLWGWHLTVSNWAEWGAENTHSIRNLIHTYLYQRHLWCISPSYSHLQTSINVIRSVENAMAPVCLTKRLTTKTKHLLWRILTSSGRSSSWSKRKVFLIHGTLCQLWMKYIISLITLFAFISPVGPKH